MKKIFLLVCVLLLGTLGSYAQTSGVAGEWRGIWTNPTGFVFTAELTLEAGAGGKTCATTGDGSIRGKIVWTLKMVGSNAPEEYAKKVDMTGTEFVKGEMKGDGFFVLRGYEKDDPNGVIGVDKYRVAISDDSQVIGGITFNNGPWTGQFIANRAQP